MYGTQVVIAVTRDELLSEMSSERARWEAALERVPREAMCAPPAGFAHSVKEHVAHVTAYEEWVVLRLRAAEFGETTSLPVDRIGFETYNDTIWDQVRDVDLDDAMQQSRWVHERLVAAVRRLRNDDLNERTELVEALDPAWVTDWTLADAIAADSYRHYWQHMRPLRAAAEEYANFE